MNVVPPNSSATNSDPEISSANQPLLNSTSFDESSPEGSSQAATEEHYSSKQGVSSSQISIGHVYVYNFSPAKPVDTVIDFSSPDATIVKTKQVGISPAASSGPFCRICHEGDINEDLLSPCFCTGTVGLVHRSCIEKWLGTSGTDRCEICRFPFATIRSPKSFVEWVRNTRSSSGQRTMVGDATCFLLLTPFAAVSSFLSIDGALKQIQWQKSIEAGCLMALATFLITVYTLWIALTIRYHLKCFTKWRLKNYHVKILLVKRHSSTNGRFLSNKRTRHFDRLMETPGIHRLRHTSVNLKSSPFNTSDNSAQREFQGTDSSFLSSSNTSPPPYGFNGTDFIERLATMFETAL